MTTEPKKKFNTRLWLAVIGAVMAAGTVPVVALDPNSFWFKLLGLVMSLTSVGCTTALGRYDSEVASKE